MRWRNNIHRIERIRRVYQPGHTAPNEVVRAFWICCKRPREQAERTGNNLSAWVSDPFYSLDAYRSADFAFVCKIGFFTFAAEIIRCRGPPQHLSLHETR